MKSALKEGPSSQTLESSYQASWIDGKKSTLDTAPTPGLHAAFGDLFESLEELPPARFGWVGGSNYNDETSHTSLFRHGARWYDPTTARWLSRDPVWPQSDGNAYRYVRNSPVNEIDPGGLATSGREPAGTFEYVPNAVSIRTTDASIPRQASQEPDLLSSEFGLDPVISRGAFLDAKSCPLCTKVGWVQIFRGRLDLYRPWTAAPIWLFPVSGGAGLLLTLIATRGWELDGSLPYANREVDPVNFLASDLILFEDIPGQIQPHYLSLGAYTKVFQQEFEVHFVCLDGREKGAVYGGYKWGHTFKAKVDRPKSLKDYTIYRWATPLTTPSTPFKGIVGGELEIPWLP